MIIKESWRPYFFGALSGLLLTASVGIAGQFFGTSTTFPRVAGWIYELVGMNPAWLEFYTVRGGTFSGSALPNWQLLFVIGIGLGAFLASMLTGTFKAERLPPMWVEQFGDSLKKRIGYSLIGGFILMIGARMAGGCPSGHGLSGVSQLGISSIVAIIFFFLAGILTVRVLYRREQS